MNETRSMGMEMSTNILVTGIPVLGDPSAKLKFTKKIGKDQIGYIREGARISQKEYQYREGSSLIRFLLLEVSQDDGFKNMRKELYKNAKAGIAVFEFTNKNSLENLLTYVSEFCNFTNHKVSLLLVGHSVNLIKEEPTEVSLDMVREYKGKIKEEIDGEDFLYSEIPSYYEDFREYFDFLAKAVLKK